MYLQQSWESKSMCSVPESIPRHGSVENKQITTHLEERAPALVAGMLLRRALLRLHRDRPHQVNKITQRFTRSKEEFSYSLDSREEVLENPRHDTAVSVVRAAVNHGAERAPHGVCLTSAALEAFNNT
jgi:hypothetical protein